jgi:hypothetical protein
MWSIDGTFYIKHFTSHEIDGDVNEQTQTDKEYDI